MPPSDFQKARDAAAASAAASSSSSSSQYLYAEVDGRPYFPTLHAKNAADDDNNLSIIQAAVAVVLASANGDASSPSSALAAVSMPPDEELAGHLTVKVVSGGITNSLYRVSGLTTSTLLADALPDTSELKGHDSVLVRVFGTFFACNVWMCDVGALCAWRCTSVHICGGELSSFFFVANFEQLFCISSFILCAIVWYCHWLTSICWHW